MTTVDTPPVSQVIINKEGNESKEQLSVVTKQKSLQKR